MRRRDVAARLGCLVLVGSTVATVARAQAPAAVDAPRPAGAEERAKLRSRIAGLRAEVELMEIEHDADREHLKALLSDVRKLEDLEAAAVEMPKVVAELKAKGVGGGNVSLPFALPGGIKLPTPEEQASDEMALNRATLLVARPLAARKAKEFVRKTTELHAKRLELDDLEAQYRASVPAGPGPRADRDEPGPASRPAVQACYATDTVERIVVLDPDQADCRVEPPTEAEVWRKVPRPAGAAPETGLAGARFVIEKVGEKVEPCKVYPLAGPCQLVHRHYKATVSFSEWVKDAYSGFPGLEHRTEVVLLDKDHLLRCRAAGHAHPVPAPRPDRTDP